MAIGSAENRKEMTEETSWACSEERTTGHGNTSKSMSLSSLQGFSKAEWMIDTK